MKKTLFTILFFFCTSVVSMGQSWEDIVYSGEYYYGEGFGKSQSEAKNMAMSELSNSIVSNVKSDFSMLTDETNNNGDIEHETRVHNVIESYSQVTLNNVKTLVMPNTAEGDFHVRCFMKRDELKKVFEGRIGKAKGFYNRANLYLNNNKIEMALRQYYWGYLLLCSLQYPNEVKDEKGNLLVVEIPNKIREILADIDVKFLGRNGDNVDLGFTYNGKPVPSLKFFYNDGTTNCPSDVKDGIGGLEMSAGYETEYYYIDIDYAREGDAYGDAEVQSMFKIVPRNAYSEASKKIEARQVANLVAKQNVEQVAGQVALQVTEQAAGQVALLVTEQAAGQVAQQVTEQAAGQVAAKVEKQADAPVAAVMPANALKPASDAQLMTTTDKYKKVIETLLGAIRTKNYYDVCDYFTIDGLEVYEKLIAYGSARVVGIPNIQFFKGANGCAVARGLQMSFTFRDNKGVKKSFVEDMVFYFDKEGKVDNISFGLGFESTNDILSREDEKNGWGHDVLAVFLEFLENYKTAYCLERLDYIRSIFSDDAVIIVGKVLERKSTETPGDENQVTIAPSQPQVVYDKLDKNTYMNNLERVFRNNNFVNLKFQNLEVQKIYNDPTKERFAIKLFQEYSSSGYSDRGYLFLFLDMTNMDEPLIKIRTWQPNDINLDEVISIADFKF